MDRESIGSILFAVAFVALFASFYIDRYSRDALQDARDQLGEVEGRVLIVRAYEQAGLREADGR